MVYYVHLPVLKRFKSLKKMPKKNITYILCNISGYTQYISIANSIDKDLFNLSFIFLDESTNALKASLMASGIVCYQLDVRTKKDIPKAIYQAVKIFKKENTSIVHTHLVNASLVGLMAAKIRGINKRIHTRHHADFHHEHYKKGVMIDNFINYLSTNIIAISKNVQSILENKEKFHSGKVELIYHGFNLVEFEDIPQKNVQKIKSTYNITGFPVIGMISRYETGKGIEYCFLAFKKLLEEFPDARLIIANAYGADKDSITKFLHTLPAQNLTEIEFEKDVKALYKSFDIFVHVPSDATFEAFGQVYIEAMAASIPGVYTLSGIANEYIENDKNAIVADYKNAEQIYSGIKKYLENTSFRETIVATAKKDVAGIFSLDKMMSELTALYLK